MPYTVDPLNAAKPADEDFALVAAEEIRSLKASVTSRLATLGTTVTAQLAANVVAVTALIDSVTFPSCQVLTGVGSWTVPTGVNSVLVIAQAGGSAQAEISGDSWGGASWSFFSEATAGEVVTKLLSVTSGDVITYTCGAGQDLIRDPASGSSFTPCYIKTLTAAGQTNFGSSVLAKAAVTRYAVNTGGYVTKDNSNYGYSGHYSGKLVDTRIANAVYTPNVSTIVAGTAGSITLFY